MVAIGGLVEIVPLFYLRSTIETVQGMRPYTPLELAGRNIYVREGCYLCHSQMIRSLRDEVERYGHYSLAAESMYDHPFQWGSKRNGPDLARVGGKYTDAWHVAHLIDPRSVVPQSIMPNYGFLMTTPLETRALVANIETNREVGVPYTDEMVTNAMTDLKAQIAPDSPEAAALLKRYPKAVVRKFNPAESRDYRGRRRHRLSADVGNARRLQALRRQSQSALNLDLGDQMSATYEWLAQFAQSAGTLYFFLFFVATLVYALWPKNAAQFKDAARMPLRED